MWSIVHKMGSPPWFYRFANGAIAWLLPIVLLALIVGCIRSLLIEPPDYRLGTSYRIIFILVSSAVVAPAGHYVMATEGLICLDC